jgi:two-component system chemotaxis sensor kinase CheA
VTDMARIQELFTAEAKELTATLETAALALEAAPDDRERLNEVFRAAHSLKGAAAMVGFNDIAALTHALETMLDMWRAGELQPQAAHFGALLRAADMLRVLIESPDGTSPDVDHQGLAAELKQLCQVEEAEAEEPAERAAVSGGSVRVRFWPQPDAFQWGGDPLLVLREVRGLVSSMRVRLDAEGLPSLDEISPDGAYFHWELELTPLPDVQLARIQEAFTFFDGVAEIGYELLDKPRAQQPTAARHVAAADTGAAPRVAASDAATIRVATEKVDKVIDLMGELVIAQAVVRELVRKSGQAQVALQEAVLLTDRHLRELQERVMSIRMVPVGAAFARVPRVVRDLAQKLDKRVRLELMGTETELDKTLMDKLSDPLMHLVRNALDHGIETPDEREASGKSDTALLQVHAYARGGNVFVEVSDDGRGLDRERIRAKALERGLLGANDHVGDEQLWKFICHPGFSTKQEVTEVSGRGVGLDVVQRNVEELGGELQIESERGRGTRFRLRLPLTLTILDGLLLCAGTETCVLPLSDIAFSLRIAPGQARSLVGLSQILDLPNETLPLLDLAQVLGHARQNAEEAPLAVVVHCGGYRYALRVDALLGQTQAVVKSLETHYRRVPGIVGATILGDGRVALILDGPGVASAAGLGRSRGDAARPSAKESTACSPLN